MRLAIAVLLSGAAFAATTQTWEMNTYQDFLRGRLNGLSLMSDGRLLLGPKMDTVYTSDQPEIWTAAQAPDGSLYLGTGNRGRLIRINAAGKSSVVWTADQPEIFAVAVDSKGVVYAATSPDGKIYRIENGKATEFFNPGARYIWSLKVAPDGTVYAGTGDQGKVFRISPQGRGEVYYETGQAHVTALALDDQGRLLAGSEPNGILYRITAQNKAFVLYDANLPEIRTIVPGPDGTIYAAALGGSLAKRVGAAAASTSSNTPAVVAPPISITVTDSQQGGITPTPKPESPKTQAATSQAPVIAAVTTVENTGVEKSALYKINPDNTVETVWSSKDENAYDLAVSGSNLLFVTDMQGRIYRLDRDRKTTLVAQANEGDATRLLESPAGLVVTTGNLGKVLRLGPGTGTSGWYESPVHDSGSVARWGRLSWHGAQNGVAFKTRTGNSARPDATWSDWANLNNGLIASPNARYIQWRAELNGTGSVDDVNVAFLPQNMPPTVRSINVSAQPAKSAVNAAASYSVTVTDSGDASAATGASSQMLSRGAGQQIQVAWQADDPDGDKLLYSLYFRGEDEHEWKLLRANMTENTYLLEGDVLADGRYFFKVTASDRPSNPANFAREAELVSAPVVVDNTPPSVSASAPLRSGSSVAIDVDANDRASALRRCEYSIDAGPWMPVEAADGVTDSPSEKFHIEVANFPAGEHLIVIRVYDIAGNAGLTKVVVR
jgi:sugar lactone lactonase YvrE